MSDRSSQSEPKLVYAFAAGYVDGRANMTELLGGKGANLAEMASLGLPVPPGFTITTKVCDEFYALGRKLPEALKPQIEKAIRLVGDAVGATFGDVDRPLLVSVRSGARASMPGMMDTILNLGLNDETVEGLAKRSGDRRFAYDSYRRFIQMYADVVLGVDHGVFEDILENFKNLNALGSDTELTAEDWTQIIEEYKQAVTDNLGRPFPQDISEQLFGAIAAVFGSWQKRARQYLSTPARHPRQLGTAVTVQAMVFGNLGENSATGVAFTRNPSTGAKEIYGEFLINAQGEDVVAGIRTPQPLSAKARQEARVETPSLEEQMPDLYAHLVEVFARLEKHYRDMQDVEFTIENGKLWILQTRSGKRTAEASLRIAVDLAEEGVISKPEAVMRVNAPALDQLLHPTLDPDAARDVLTTGLPASPGAASGEIVFTADDAETARAPRP